MSTPEQTPTPEIREEELQRRIKLLPPRKSAGPDSPIYRSGLTFTSVRKPPTPTSR
jgi:hypothetical protein